jgi:hypothetical protein
MLQFTNGESYSAIEHVGRIVCPGNWERALMAMLTTAFDISVDQPAKRFLVMAGFVSEAKAWEEFDKSWRSRLAKDNLSYFHMQRFAHATTHPTKPFDKSWIGKETRRQKLISDLLDIIQSHAFRKFGVVVQSEAAKSLSATFQYEMREIEVAGRMMAIEVESWRVREKFSNRVEHIFEDGDDGKGQLEETVRFVNGVRPIFRAKKDNPDKGIVGFTPLQAADILAFEIKKAADDASFKNGQVPNSYQFRFPYTQLNTILGQPRMWNMGSSSDVDEISRVDRHFQNNPLPEYMQR